MLEQMIGVNIFLFLLVFTRIGAALMWLPGVGTAYVPTNIRLAAAVLISFAMLPTLAPRMPTAPDSPSALTLLIAGEVLIGSLFGIIGRVALAALHTAGTFIALFASIANAFVTDPVAEQQSSTVSGFLSILGATLVVATDLTGVAAGAGRELDLFVPGAPLMVATGDAFARQVGRPSRSACNCRRLS